MHENPIRPEVGVIEIHPSPDCVVDRDSMMAMLSVYDVELIVLVDWNVLVNTLVVDAFVRELIDVAPTEECGFQEGPHRSLRCSIILMFSDNFFCRAPWICS